MDITTDKDGQVLVLTLQGRMDALSHPEFDQCASDLVGQGERLFVVDLSGLDYISSAGLRSLLGLLKTVQPQGGNVALCGLTGVVRNVFEVVGFQHVFVIDETREEALSRLS